MGTTPSMSLVTGFESQSPEAEGSKARNESFGFENLYTVLTTDQARSGDVFGAWAKRMIRHLTVNPIVMENRLNQYPRWTSQGTCSLHIADLKNATTLRSGLEGLVQGLVRTIEETCGRERSVTLDALTADITMTGPDEITFRLKQKWCWS